MSISDIAAAGPARLQGKHHRVLTLDIERLPGRARVQHHGLTIEGDFWDLGGWKHALGGRRIHADDVLEWPRTVCIAWRFYGDKHTTFVSEWDDGHEPMLRAAWQAVDECTVLYGHAVERFDLRKLNSEWLRIGLPAPRPPAIVDTLKEARKVLGEESFTLAAMTKALGITTKTDKYSIQMARDAVAGVKTAQRKLRNYNCGDIAASEALVDRLRGYLPAHPHNLLAGMSESPVCNQCWGTNLERAGEKLAATLSYALYRCLDCGANVQGARVGHIAPTRGAR